MEKAFTAYQSWLTLIEVLSEAERGRLFTAALQYGVSGEEADLTGNERIAWPTVKSDIDRERGSLPQSHKKKQPRGDKSDFDRFYEVYPRKVGVQKARVAFEAAMKRPNPPTVEQLIASVEAHKRTWDWQKDGGVYIPHPTTYLNQDRWRDDLSTAPKEPTRENGKRSIKQMYPQHDCTDEGLSHLLVDLDREPE